MNRNLADDLERLAQRGPHADQADVIARATHRVDEPGDADSGRDGRRRFVAAVAAGLLTMGGVAALIIVGGRASDGPASPSIDELVARGEWVRIADPPLDARDGSTIAWSGSEILVVGGEEFFCPDGGACGRSSDAGRQDGAAYDPVSGQWRPIAEAPIEFADAPDAVLGGSLYVLASADESGTERALLEYSIADDVWTRIDTPGDLQGTRMVATDRQLVVYRHDNYSEPGTDHVYDTETGEWRPLDVDPLQAGLDREMVWDGTALYLFERPLLDRDDGLDGPFFTLGARLGGGEWEVLAESNLMGTTPWFHDGARLVAPSLGCIDGGQNNGYGQCVPRGSIYDTVTGTWSELPDAPERGDREAVFRSGGVSENDLLIIEPGTAMFDATTDEWFLLPAIDPEGTQGRRDVQEAGRFGFAFGGWLRRDGEELAALTDEAWIWRADDAR